VQSVATWFENSIGPFLLLLLSLVVIQHFYSIVQLVLLLVSTGSSTLHLQAFVAAPMEHKLAKSRDVLILVNLNIWALSLLGLPDPHVWRAVLMRTPVQPFSVRIHSLVQPDPYISYAAQWLNGD
jgi:hypothetical protein